MAASCTVKPITEFGGERRTYEGVVQPFAARSHDYYVIGKICDGKRALNLNGSSLAITHGDVVLFNPGDVHSCIQTCDSPLAYDSLTLSRRFFNDATLRFPDAFDESVRTYFDRTLSLLDEELVNEAADELVQIGALLELAGHVPKSQQK